jgi:hypothetical protein
MIETAGVLFIVSYPKRIRMETHDTNLETHTPQDLGQLVDNLNSFLFRAHSLAHALYLSDIGAEHAELTNRVSNTKQNITALIMEHLGKALEVTEDLEDLADDEQEKRAENVV